MRGPIQKQDPPRITSPRCSSYQTNEADVRAQVQTNQTTPLCSSNSTQSRVTELDTLNWDEPMTNNPFSRNNWCIDINATPDSVKLSKMEFMPIKQELEREMCRLTRPSSKFGLNILKPRNPIISKNQLKRIGVINPNNNTLAPTKVRVRLQHCLEQFLPTYSPDIFLDVSQVAFRPNSFGVCSVCDNPKHANSCLYCAISLIPKCVDCRNYSITSSTSCAICSGPQIVGPHYTYLADDEIYFRYFVHQLLISDRLSRHEIVVLTNTISIFVNFNGKIFNLNVHPNNSCYSLKPQVSNLIFVPCTDFSLHTLSGAHDSSLNLENLQTIYVTLKLKAGGKNKNRGRSPNRYQKRKDAQRNDREHYSNDDKKKYKKKLQVAQNDNPKCYICYQNHKASQCKYYGKPGEAYVFRRKINALLTPESIVWHNRNAQVFVDNDEDFELLKAVDLKDLTVNGKNWGSYSLDGSKDIKIVESDESSDSFESSSSTPSSSRPNNNNKRDPSSENHPPDDSTPISPPNNGGSNNNNPNSGAPVKPPGSTLPKRVFDYQVYTTMLHKDLQSKLNKKWVSYRQPDKGGVFKFIHRRNNNQKFEIELLSFSQHKPYDVRASTNAELDVLDPLFVTYSIKRMNRFKLLTPLLKKFDYKKKFFTASLEMLFYALTPNNTLGDRDTCLLKIRNACTQFQKFNINRDNVIDDNIYVATELLAQHYYLRNKRKFEDFQMTGSLNQMSSSKLDTTLPPAPYRFPIKPKTALILLGSAICLIKLISLRKHTVLFTLAPPIQNLPTNPHEIFSHVLAKELELSPLKSTGTSWLKSLFIPALSAVKTSNKSMPQIPSRSMNGLLSPLIHPTVSSNSLTLSNLFKPDLCVKRTMTLKLLLKRNLIMRSSALEEFTLVQIVLRYTLDPLLQRFKKLFFHTQLLSKLYQSKSDLITLKTCLQMLLEAIIRGITLLMKAISPVPTTKLSNLSLMITSSGKIQLPLQYCPSSSMLFRASIISSLRD